MSDERTIGRIEQKLEDMSGDIKGFRTEYRDDFQQMDGRLRKVEGICVRLDGPKDQNDSASTSRNGRGVFLSKWGAYAVLVVLFLFGAGLVGLKVDWTKADQAAGVVGRLKP